MLHLGIQNVWNDVIGKRYSMNAKQICSCNYDRSMMWQALVIRKTILCYVLLFNIAVVCSNALVYKSMPNEELIEHG